MKEQIEKPRNYQAFVAGIFSGITKLSVGHPFDTIKVRLQTQPKSHFSGPLQCLLQTVRQEGVAGLYKGATPPLIGWVFMDSVTLGSLSFYRRFLQRTLFAVPSTSTGALATKDYYSSSQPNLPPLGHAISGFLAGATVSTIASPIEHIKARLQVQFSSTKRLYNGPVDCATKIYTHHGIRGIYHGFVATLIFRSAFFFWWGSYDMISTELKSHTALSTSMINFWAGGLSAQIFWCISYPSDVIKQRIMTDALGAGLGDGNPKWKGWGDGWWSAARGVWKEAGWRGYWRGFLPCFMRAFPANAVAMATFEGVLRSLP